MKHQIIVSMVGLLALTNTAASQAETNARPAITILGPSLARTNPPPHPQMVATKASLTSSNVVAIANSYCREKGIKVGEYSHNVPEYLSYKDSWVIFFDANSPMPVFGDQFSIYIHDKSGAVTLYAGL